MWERGIAQGKSCELTDLSIRLYFPVYDFIFCVQYWQLIKDVRDVLNVKINSVTIGALIVMIWNRAKIEISVGEELYIDIEAPSLRPKIEVILKRPLNISGNGYPGFLESGK